MIRRLVTEDDKYISYSWCHGECASCLLRFRCMTCRDKYIFVTAREWFKCKKIGDIGIIVEKARRK